MLPGKKIWWLLPAFCLGAGTLAAVLLQSFAGLNQTVSLKEGGLLTTILMLTISQVIWIVRAYPTKVGILGCAIGTGLLTGCAGAWLHGISQAWLLSSAEQRQYESWLTILAVVRWILYPALLLLFSITIALYRRIAETEQRYALQQDAAALLKEAELFKLRQQLQPHFLYNSLNAISSLIIMAPDKAGEMISRLSDFLRASVKQGRSELVPFREEAEYLQNYLWIEAVRFGDRLHIGWTTDAAATEARLPPFLLQPLMENAIRFGVYGRTGTVTISVNITLTHGMLSISISNPYDAGMKAASGTGFGLEGVRRRLYLMYARHDLLLTSGANGHFTATIQIPQ